MAGLKEIKRRLRSVKNTQKITYAMKLVSAAKLRKAQEAVTKSREYTTELGSLLSQLLQETAGSNLSHPLMEVRPEVKNVAVLVVGGQRGLCGGYNSNVNKKVEVALKQFGSLNSSVVLGKKPAEYYRRKGLAYTKAFEELPENANAWPIADIAGDLEAGFRSGAFDEVWVIYTKFKSAISQTVQLEKLLPLDANLTALTASGVKGAAPIAGAPSIASAETTGVTKFEPSATEVFSALLPRIVSAKIRQYCLDAKASETAARMTSMDAATKNAKQLSRKLELQHNKIRQARITSELLDILGGAEAVK
jgi:F-type H+-transporting ATPase subunit gamma